TSSKRDWSSDVCSSDLAPALAPIIGFTNLRLIPYIAGSVIPAIVAEIPQAIPSALVSLSLLLSATPKAAPPCAMLEQNNATMTRSEERRVGTACRAA